MRDHVVHCAELWSRQFRTLWEGWKYVDSVNVDLKHTMHCADILMSQANLPAYHEMPIKVFVDKPRCHVREIQTLDAVLYRRRINSNITAIWDFKKVIH